jgi:hypothetical protein
MTFGLCRDQIHLGQGPVGHQDVADWAIKADLGRARHGKIGGGDNPTDQQKRL